MSSLGGAAPGSVAWKLVRIVPANGEGGNPVIAWILVSSSMKSSGGLLARVGFRITLGFLKSPPMNMMKGTPAGNPTLADVDLSGPIVATGNTLDVEGLRVDPLGVPGEGEIVGADPVSESEPCDSEFAV